ncbi:MAG TPA: hypothetical protein VNN55_02955 [bacterium]|nr:hypothetical protein [bacterium]
MGRHYRLLGGVIVSLALAFGSARADVTVKRLTTMDGMGGLLKSTTTSTETYAGDKMVSDGETKLENKLLKMLGGGKPIKTTQVTRLDKELFWDINHKDKKYSEMTFAEMRAMMDSLGAMFSGGGNPMAQQEPAFDTAEYTFSPPEFKVERTGKKETIAGYTCDQAILTMKTVGTNRKTGETMTLDLIMDMMLAANVAGADEINAFGTKMSQAIGQDIEPGSARSMSAMLAMYGVDARQLEAEARKLEGFALKTVMSFTLGGDAMARSQAEAEEKSDGADDEEGAEGEEAASDDDGSVAAKALGGLFGKKDKKQDEEKAKDDAPTAPPGALFWMSSTVTGIEAAGAPAEKFEVPAGYKLETTGFQK